MTKIITCNFCGKSAEQGSADWKQRGGEYYCPDHDEESEVGSLPASKTTGGTK